MPKSPQERFVAGHVIEGSPVESCDDDRMVPQQWTIIRERCLTVATINVVLQGCKAEKLLVTMRELIPSRYLISIRQEGSGRGRVRMLKSLVLMESGHSDKLPGTGGT